MSCWCYHVEIIGSLCYVSPLQFGKYKLPCYCVPYVYIAGIIDETFNLTIWRNLCTSSILSSSLIIISSIDNRVTNHFIKFKICQVQFFTNSSNLNPTGVLLIFVITFSVVKLKLKILVRKLGSIVPVSIINHKCMLAKSLMLI